MDTKHPVQNGPGVGRFKSRELTRYHNSTRMQTHDRNISHSCNVERIHSDSVTSHKYQSQTQHTPHKTIGVSECTRSSHIALFYDQPNLESLFYRRAVDPQVRKVKFPFFQRVTQMVPLAPQETDNVAVALRLHVVVRFQIVHDEFIRFVSLKTSHTVKTK